MKDLEPTDQPMSEVKETTYWKSLSELANNKEYQKFTEREFPENATELSDGVSRRGFLRVMGASVALAGLASCRRPVQKILPYSKQPEDVVEGKPLYYATAMPVQGNLVGLIAENHEGRPTKLEGNDMHPASKGGTSIYNQAAILGLYDPDRSKSPLNNGNKVSRQEFEEFAASHFANTNQRIAFISEANSSPTYNKLKEQALSKFSNASWVTYEPFGEDNVLEGSRIAFGSRLRPHYQYGNADVVVSLNDDFMASTHPNSVEYAKQLSARRKVTDTSGELNRIYAVEDTFSLTGSYADNRLRLKASQVEAFTYALAAALSTRVNGLDAFSGYSNEFSDHKWITVLADELAANAGNSTVSAGAQHKAEVHAAVAAINQALGNAGSTVQYLDVPHVDEQSSQQAFADVVADMKAGNIDTAVIVGANPAYTASGSVDFKNALSNIETVINLSDYVDETARASHWHVNRAHFLEAWGDGYSYSGARSIIQPQILPLHDGLSEIEFLNAIVNGSIGKGYDLVQETFRSYYNTGFENRWTTILHDGIDTADNFNAPSVSLASGFGSNMSRATSNVSTNSGIEVVIKPDATLYDGRYANLGWLQELPDPMTKVTWDNVALMSPATAEQLGVENEDVVEITVNGQSVRIAAWLQPGHADDSITLTTGYGRKGLGRVATSYIDYTAGGVDVYPLRNAENALYASADVSSTGDTYEIACVQDHHSLEGRDMYRQASISEYKENPDFASFESVHTYPVPGMKEAKEMGEDEPISLFDEQTYPDYEPQWGMAIDLNSCFGCGVCVIACQSENNIPVIGKKEVKNGREMHWIRNDRYYVGDNADEPQAVHQPVPCMHCELAPCEQVCPVAATTHSEDGMNQMTYNRCIGTRYCANNCPYKVRRFNFFNYPKEYLTTGDDPDIIQMAMNPEVTVRFRGVMEKCTYCVQRVNRAKIEAKKETGSPKPADGTVKTACQQACPADAIYFGDLTDDNSEVAKMKRNERNFQMLEELNTRPRTSYMAKLTNPNPALA
ncbi:TAT-variant-translocated molybdopterin oxidoreductase [Gracilimonas mengyeensis]|uniref:Quinol:cytochrome c oxidoreductase iron-sulfur protein n=1 Tax=Gracilimonas mengyeensis TaxID=1302730 RepID=A0A521BAP8_9BACT|nr:TAT-variant-translocated molybdopterin oxidoreductase [Gracilimonas mengyeensis]SMO44162.1 quinol:cytochrome c oxidoreductase iron-sulfur protein precursor [Gracilimonas mengyeensis]